jgi:phenylpropionate dioxygenase-like ring-hydroxylating dioxygenase large terminal subunit
MKLFLILSTLYQTSALLFHALQTIRRNAPELDCNYYSCAPRPSCMSPPLNQSLLSEQDKYDLGWYVVANKKDIRYNKPFQATIWNKNYVIWKNATSGEIHGLDDVCPHKGASLAGGKIVKGCVTCPYHGYEYNGEGTLSKIPGINFTLSAVHNVAKYHVVEKNGWVYLNTNPYNASLDVNIFEEPEAVGGDFSPVFLEMDFNCYSRILSENSLDVMHIAFVHTFGNAEKPAPLQEYPPTQISPYHFKTSYLYESGKESMVKKVFDIKTLKIENEFVLPHTTVARVIFDKYISTVITFALPISETRSKLFVKTYRNFWNNELGDMMTEKMMRTTMLQDKAVVENIDMRYMEGKFNMKYDKLQNTYKTFYKRFVHRFCDVPTKVENKTIDN